MALHCIDLLSGRVNSWLVLVILFSDVIMEKFGPTDVVVGPTLVTEIILLFIFVAYMENKNGNIVNVT